MITRALIVRKPWIDLILSGEKTWEMRSRATTIRGRVGLIEKGSGLIVGEVEIVDCSANLGMQQLFDHKDKHFVGDLNHLLVNWPIAWKLAFPKRYDKPIPYNHPQGAVIWVKLEGNHVR